MGHEDAHVAFVMAAQDGERWWWVRWDSARHEVVDIDVCPWVDGTVHDDCRLPGGTSVRMGRSSDLLDAPGDAWFICRVAAHVA
ncbi:hypothetical protein Axi01nite_72090 [Actinoplanes xinjiangensis]|nr:hypothetical protein Axi01nite_72090 [Actinoplanes xinjiangensis]